MKILPNNIPQVGRKYLISTDGGFLTRKYVLVEIKDNDHRTHCFDCIEEGLTSYLIMPGLRMDIYLKNGGIKLIK